MNDDFAYLANRHGFYCVPTSYLHREVPKLLAAGEVYEPRTLDLISRWASKGDVVTGGAFVGDFLPAISTGAGRENRVWSFEPAPLSHTAATRTIAMNRLANVSLVQVAVGATPETLPLAITEEPGGKPMVARAKISTQPVAGVTIDVDVVTLDALVPETRRVAVLHLDVEGHELPALDGAARILSRDRPLVVLEAPRRRHVQVFTDWFAAHHRECDYHCTGRMERNAFFLALAAA